MILPLYVADGSFWHGDDLYYTMVQVSLDPIPSRSTWLPSGNRCDWTGGDRPTFGVKTPAGTKVEMRRNYDPRRSIKRLPRSEDEPEKITPYEEPDYPAAIVRYGVQEHDAETMLVAAIHHRNGFSLVEAPTGCIPSFGDSPHQLSSTVAKTRADLQRDHSMARQMAEFATESEEEEFEEEAPEGLLVVVHAGWEVCRLGDELVWKYERLSFEPFGESIETKEGDPETVYVSGSDVQYRVLAPKGATLEPGRGLVEAERARWPQPWASCAYAVIAMAVGRVNGYEFIEGEALYQERRRWRRLRKPTSTDPIPEPSSTGPDRYPSDTRVEARKGRSRSELPGQLSFF